MTDWYLEHPASLIDREWDDEIVVLNTLTGSTHLLEPAAAFIYRVLQSGAQSESALAELLVAELDTGDPADAKAMVEVTLLEFLRLGLVASTPR